MCSSVHGYSFNEVSIEPLKIPRNKVTYIVVLFCRFIRI